MESKIKSLKTSILDLPEEFDSYKTDLYNDLTDIEYIIDEAKELNDTN